MLSFQGWSMESILPVNCFYWLGPETQEDNMIIMTFIEDALMLSFIAAKL